LFRNPPLGNLLGEGSDLSGSELSLASGYTDVSVDEMGEYHKALGRPGSNYLSVDDYARASRNPDAASGAVVRGRRPTSFLEEAPIPRGILKGTVLLPSPGEDAIPEWKKTQRRPKKKKQASVCGCRCEHTAHFAAAG